MLSGGNYNARVNAALPPIWLLLLAFGLGAGAGGTAVYLATKGDEDELEAAKAAQALAEQHSRELARQLTILQNARPAGAPPLPAQCTCESSLYSDEVFASMRVHFTNPPNTDNSIYSLFMERQKNVEYASFDFSNPLYALQVSSRDPNLTPNERALMTGMGAGLTGVINLHALGYPYFGTTQEIAGWSTFDATVLIGARREDFYSPWWIAYQAAKSMGCDPEKFMTALYPIDATCIMMLDYGEQKLNDEIGKVRRGEWLVRQQNGRYYLCMNRTWNENQKIELVEYFRTAFWQGTTYNQRMEEIYGALDFAQRDSSASIPSFEMVEQLDPNRMDVWDIPERVIYRLGLLQKFAEEAARRLAAVRPDRVPPPPPPPPPPRDAGTRPVDAGPPPRSCTPAGGCVCDTVRETDHCLHS